MRQFLYLLIIIWLPGSLLALSPDEQLQDPELEQRAREISEQLRCVVCRNETIDASSAPLARDMRLAVRLEILKGADDQQVLDFMVERYGEFVLMRPPSTGLNLLLWMAAPLMLLGVGVGLGLHFRARPSVYAEENQKLDAKEAERLARIMEE